MLSSVHSIYKELIFPKNHSYNFDTIIDQHRITIMDKITLSFIFTIMIVITHKSDANPENCLGHMEKVRIMNY